MSSLCSRRIHTEFQTLFLDSVSCPSTRVGIVNILALAFEVQVCKEGISVNVSDINNATLALTVFEILSTKRSLYLML